MMDLQSIINHIWERFREEHPTHDDNAPSAVTRSVLLVRMLKLLDKLGVFE